jgi:uncharacterized alpha-E superfamily protein
MLSRTADHLFWMARYMERAENTARMLDVNYQTSLLPQSRRHRRAGLARPAVDQRADRARSAEVREVDAAQRHGLHGARRATCPASGLPACRARERACRARRADHRGLGDQNQTWLEFNRMLKDDAFERDPAAFFEWVKFRSHLSRGVTVGTMLQDEALYFLRIGTFLERADNTARLLDVKFQALAGGDYFGPAHGPRKDPGGRLLPLERHPALGVRLRDLPQGLPQRDRARKVAELLILRPDMPRSLAACMNEVVANLELVANEQQSGETLPPRRPPEAADLRYGRIDEILATGLHAYLTQFLDRVNDLGAGISRDFLACHSGHATRAGAKSVGGRPAARM